MYAPPPCRPPPLPPCTTPELDSVCPVLTPTPASEELAETYLAAIRGSTAALQEFAGALPKGGDIHIHLTGAPYAEDVAQGAAAAGAWLCTDTLQVAAPPASGADNATCPGGWQPLAAALAAPNGNDVLQALVREWSFQEYAGSDHYW